MADSQRDAAGLEQRIEALGVPAAVHYMPAGRLCNPRVWDQPPDPAGREVHPFPHVAIGQSDDGAFTFTFDSTAVPEGRSLLVWAQYAVPEHGQASDLVASIAVEWAAGDVDQCQLVDGSIEGWPFQEGAAPGEG